MIDKEKQIEEMAKDWCKYRLCREYCCRPYEQKACSLEMRYVNKLIELGYEKITETEVVISKEEYERLQSTINRLRAYDKERDIQLHANLISETEKKTATKIYTYVNCFGTHNWERFKNFLKQFGVDLGE